jgi:hypothetical protein
VEYIKIWLFSGEVLEIDENLSIAGTYAKIRTGYLPDANLERYHCVAWRRRSRSTLDSYAFHSNFSLP